MSPSCPVPKHGMITEALFQQVVCPVAGNACAAVALGPIARAVPAQHTSTAATATTPMNPCRLVVIFGLLRVISRKAVLSPAGTVNMKEFAQGGEGISVKKHGEVLQMKEANCVAEKPP